MEITYPGALIAGLLSFLSPCILPMVPFYLSAMAGESVALLRQTGALPARARAALTGRATLFAAGVVTIFIALGLGSTVIGAFLREWIGPMRWLAAGLLVLFGLHFLDGLRIPLLYRRAAASGGPGMQTALGAYVTGLAFGFGWVPCVGPVLTAILIMASGADDPARGGGLLLTYGIGMTAPFVLAAALSGPVLRGLIRYRGVARWVAPATGVMLLIFAALVAFDGVAQIADWILARLPWLIRVG